MNRFRIRFSAIFLQLAALSAAAVCFTAEAESPSAASGSAPLQANGAPAGAAAASSAPAGTLPALPMDLPSRFPAGSIARPQQAEEALSEIGLQRAWLNARYVNEQRACYGKFFTSRCLDQARERHRVATDALRPIEVEANAFLRRYTAEQRDLALAQRREEDQADQKKRDEARKEREARLAKSEAQRTNGNAATPQKGAPAENRVAIHEEKLRQQRAEDAANAQKRAENVAAFERKKREAEQRQREVAAKRAAKEKERAEKEHADAAAAASANGAPSAGAAAGQPAKP